MDDSQELEFDFEKINILSFETKEWLCRFVESALDQGVSFWRSPYQNAGLLAYFKAWLDHTLFADLPWQTKVREYLKRHSLDGRKIIMELWIETGLSQEEWQRVCLRILFEIKGWSGMVNKFEMDPSSFRDINRCIKIEDLLAIMLLIAKAENFDLKLLSRPFGESKTRIVDDIDDRRISEIVFGKILVDGAEKDRPGDEGIDQNMIGQIRKLLFKFDRNLTERVWQIAFEHSVCGDVVNNLRDFWRQTKLDGEGVAVSASATSLVEAGARPKFQVFTCMDDREESLRRILEAVAPECDTYGVLGNYGLDMKYLSHYHVEPRWQCPPVVKPRRVLIEGDRVGKDQKANAGIGHKFVRAHFSASRKPIGGAAASLLTGPIAGIGLVMSAVSPRLAFKFHQKMDLLIHPESGMPIDLTRRQDPDFGEIGYTKDEQAEMVYSILAGTALNGEKFSDLVIVLAHQSTSANNPYLQTYGCGACSGNSGSPNSKVFAEMANDEEVRALLQKRGISIPNRVRFVAGVHDTSSDVIQYFGLDRSLNTETARNLFENAESLLNRATELNALERCGRFSNVKVKSSPAKAARAVRRRAIDLSEPRPEYGHARACLAIFGRRDLTSGFNLDRRSFLLSYDEAVDHDGSILRSLVHAALPVVANITLDYFFSSVDVEAFGAGSKLPLNISAMIGVVTGSSGDLRIGLASQMTEIHEPIRGLAFIEASQSRVEEAVFSHARLKRLVENEWLRIGAICPKSRQITLWSRSGWIDAYPQNLSQQKGRNQVAETGAFAL